MAKVSLGCDGVSSTAAHVYWWFSLVMPVWLFRGVLLSVYVLHWRSDELLAVAPTVWIGLVCWKLVV